MNRNTMTEIENLFKQSTYRPDPENENALVITYDLNAAEALIYIEHVVHAIIESKDDELFTVIDHGNGVKHVTPTRLAKAILLAINNVIGKVTDHFPIHEFNPYIKVFFKNLGTGELIEIIKVHESLKSNSNFYHDAVDYGMFMTMVAGIKALVDSIRQDAQSPEFKQIIYNARRSSKKNYEGLIEYIDSLFARHDRLLVLRIDFAYRMGNVITTEPDIDIKYREAKDDLKHFLNNTKSNDLFKHLLGHVWKLEYGAEKGFHFHVLFFFNGARVWKDKKLAMLIGKYWKNKITNGRGIYYNCNANKALYRNLGIGMIKYDNMALRVGLCKAAEYLIKVDYFARLLTPDNGRTFGRGEILEPKGDNDPGRPRSECPEAA
ncbi:YagK/YfjJ domain-containing protein [Methylobacter sp.]|uniref:YagK/YfjJ domain-containing protein n=1 Tax=Methylobacter sp. TaxID=2051955 RepID=UPI003DA2975B